MTVQPRVPKTLLIGVDGADDAILSAFADDGHIPNITSIVDSGIAGPLESHIPPWTPSTWPSLYTGMNPGKHGIFDFLEFDGDEWDAIDASDLRKRPIWDHLDHYGLSSVVVNVPVTNPPEPFEGALVPGYTAPADPTCYPEGLLEDLRYQIGEYRVYPEGGEDASLSDYIDLVSMRGRAFRYLVDQFVPAFGFVHFQVTNSVLRNRPEDEEALEETYRAVDEEIGAICEAFEPENVILASAHGMHKCEGYRFRVNEFLREAGYLESKRGGTGLPSRGAVTESRFEAGATEPRPDRSVLSRLSAVLAKTGLTSQRIASLLDSVGLGNDLRRRTPASARRAATEQVDVRASRAYVRSPNECGIRINLAGRDPGGVVSRGRYDDVRASLVSLLSSVKTPDGDPVFEDVAPSEEYFEGAATADAVDIVAVPASFDHVISTGISEDVFDDVDSQWTPTHEGFIAAAGEAFDTSASLDDAHLFDVAPTVLSAFDIPADEHMDGATLPIVESSGVRPYPSIGRRERQPRSEPEVGRHFSDLGYLDRDS